MSGSDRYGSLSRVRPGAIWARAGLAALLVVLSCGPASAAPCTLKEAASLPASFKNGEVLVDVGVNGAPAKFLIGTRSPFTQISRALALRLNLAITSQSFRVSAAQGTLAPDGVIVSQFRIGKMVAGTDTFAAMDEGGDGTTGQFSGILGQSYLGNFDIELDPALGLVNLFAPLDCPAGGAYWASEHLELPITHDQKRRPMAVVTLDGKQFTAYIDTGASRSSIKLETAKEQLGVPADIEAPLPTPVSGSDNASDPTYTFKELVFGPITIRHPQLALQRYRALDLRTGSHVKLTAADDAPVIIGMDILGRFHSMISEGTGRIYFTLPNERLQAPAAPPKS